MRLLAALLMLAIPAYAQGGRDGSKGVLFVAWDVTVESDAIHRIAWRALEAHNVDRRRIATFAGDEKKAKEYLRANKNVPMIVAYDRRIAFLASTELPNTPILKVYEEHGAHVHAWVDRKRFFDAVEILLDLPRGLLHKWLEKIKAMRKDLPGLSSMEGLGQFAWMREGGGPQKGSKVLSTSGHVAEGRAILTMRPDPRSLGLHVAAQVLGYIRSKKPFRRVTVKRMRLTVDLAAAKRAKIIVPLKLLARADVVRRGR